MNKNESATLAFTVGVVANKIFPESTWLLVGGAAAVFLMNSAGTQSAIQRGASSGYAYAKSKTGK